MFASRPKPGGPTDWLVTYGDMMTLVVTFFVLLTAMSQVQNEERLQDTLAAFQSQFHGTSDVVVAGGILPRDPVLAKAINEGRRRRTQMFAAVRSAMNDPKDNAKSGGDMSPQPLLVIDLSTAEVPKDAGNPLGWKFVLSPSQLAEVRRVLTASDDRMNRKIEIHVRIDEQTNVYCSNDQTMAACRAFAAALIAQGVNPRRIGIFCWDGEGHLSEVYPMPPPAQPVRIDLYLRDE